MNAIVKIDSKGRVLIPKNIRKIAELREGSYVNIAAQGRSILIEPLEPSASKHRGSFKISRWPEDLDEFIVEVIKDWWKPQDT
jgi:AbrB family looped-hinge helix DNA binding protein